MIECIVDEKTCRIRYRMGQKRMEVALPVMHKKVGFIKSDLSHYVQNTKSPSGFLLRSCMDTG